MKSSLYEIEGYNAVIPYIQNIYPPEETKTGWQFGFKYTSGIFEFFQFKTLKEANIQHKKLLLAIENYWRREK